MVQVFVQIPAPWAEILTLLIKELFDGFGDVGDLICGELRIDGKGEDFLGSLFSDREITFVIAQRFVTFLKMEGHWIVNTIADAIFRQVGTQGISLGSPYRKLVIDMGVPRLNHRKGDVII